MLKKIIQVIPTYDFKVYCYFSDDKIKLFDVTPFLNKGVFSQISNSLDFVNKCCVMNGTLSWDLSGKFDPTNCLDIDPETIYISAIDVADPIAS